MPPTHFLATELIVPWQEEVVERTDGRVTFDYYPGGQLVESTELFAAVESGVVDAAFFTPTVAAPVDLPLSGVVALPGIETPAGLPEATEPYNEFLLETLGSAEWADKGVKPLLGVVAGQYQLVNRGAPIRGVEDWHGLTVRGASGMLDVMTVEAGGAAATLGTNEVYEGLQRRTIDTSITPGESAIQYRLHEVAESISTNAQLGVAGVSLGIAQSKWDSFPKDIQEAIEAASVAALENYGKGTGGMREEIMEEAAGQVEFYELTPAELESLQPAMKAAQEAWIVEQESHGYDGRGILDEWARVAKPGADK
ncbi:TRAP transporter substrate-binding protein DctP [Leucobacter aridicollis]|uniref:TRAP transporter substrate-binding protein DctP n=1 Tax=Leucobacter aridicollis TaxID=283878 RepID=UPI0021065F42|nr:TRAP transporter substrate-binding protein DctP [Leucobacter aridicollis]UTX54340.1 TRAP transporter substrate-binding protein DctP [Leucobacter aridicollis]